MLGLKHKWVAHHSERKSVAGQSPKNTSETKPRRFTTTYREPCGACISVAKFWDNLNGLDHEHA